MSLWTALSAPSRADYTYGGTELSWEWLTDASRAIVVGPVTGAGEDGFALKVEQVLKRRGVTVDEGQSVGGEVLGRAQLHDQATLIREIGWPSLSDVTTYPDASEIRDRPWRPRFHRQETWTRGDRCLVFYGRDLQAPLQVVNLDRLVTIKVEFLALDLAGQPVKRVERLIRLIQDRVAATRDDRGRPRVRSAGINYPPPNSPIDYHSYYYVLAPPDERLAQLWQPEILKSPSKPTTESVFYPAGEELGDRAMAPRAVWYWYFSRKSQKDFAADAQQERDAAARALFRSERGEEDIRRRVAHHGVTDYYRYQIYRQHRINYRTYPLGWSCVRSYDQDYIAFVDGYTLQVHSVDAASKTVDQRVLLRRDAHRARTYVEFSPDSRFLTYTTAENAVVLIDLESGQLLWTAKPATQTKDSLSRYISATVCLEFSHDQRYLAQQSQLRMPGPVERPKVWARNRGAQAVHIWNVATGDLAFTPYRQWRAGLRYIAFHPDDSSLVRLRAITSEVGGDGIWHVPTGKLRSTLTEGAEWDNG